MSGIGARAAAEQAADVARIGRALAGWVVAGVDLAPMPGGGGYLALRLRRVAVPGAGTARLEKKTAVLGFTELGIWLEREEGA